MRKRAAAFVASLGPVGWVLCALAAAVLLFKGADLLGFRFDPFDLTRKRAERAEARADYSEADAAARSLEVEGEREQAARVDTYHTQVIEVRDFTARAEAEARSAPDANEPLPADRAARLGDHDRELCRLAPASCAPGAADAGDADGG